jgi:hypothetical protein
MSNLGIKYFDFTNSNVIKTITGIEIVLFLGFIALIVILSIKITKLNSDTLNILNKEFNNKYCIDAITKPPTEYNCPICPKGWKVGTGTNPQCYKPSTMKSGNGVYDCAPGKHSPTANYKCDYNPPSEQRITQYGKPC